MDRSVRQSMDPVRRGVHGPGVSVSGHPLATGRKFDCILTLLLHYHITH